jgi:hypothetical protein
VIDCRLNPKNDPGREIGDAEAAVDRHPAEEVLLPAAMADDGGDDDLAGLRAALISAPAAHGIFGDLALEGRRRGGRRDARGPLARLRRGC